MRCDNCGKAGQFGHNVSHSKRRTNHRWVANIQSTRIMMKGKDVRMSLCTRCLRSCRRLVQTAA